MSIRPNLASAALLLALTSGPAVAEVAIPYTFQAGEKAMAAEVNANFAALRDALNEALERIDDLEAEIATLQANKALALGGYVELVPDPNVQNEYTVRFSGVNVQIVNGTGETHHSNGLGNLIVGYNEPRVGAPLCSNGQYDDENDCSNNGAVWSDSHKSGSHNIVGGDGNAYSSHGGLVVGSGNAITHAFASVSGGSENTASGPWSSVGAGEKNIASGPVSSVSGGSSNAASSPQSSVSGGIANIASGPASSVSGGDNNTASGPVSSVSGGSYNTASGMQSSVSGGGTNVAGGVVSSILGGTLQEIESNGLGESIPPIPVE